MIHNNESDVMVECKVVYKGWLNYITNKEKRMRKIRTKGLTAAVLVTTMLGSSISVLGTNKSVLETKSEKSVKENVSVAETSETKGEFSFKNKDYYSLKNADISSDEAAEAKEQREESVADREYAPDNIIVLYDKKNNTSNNTSTKCMNQVIDKGDEGCREIMDTKDYTIVSIDLNNSKTVEKALEEYKNMDGIAAVQPDYCFETAETTYPNTNDTYRNNQWYLDRIDAKPAWDFVKSRSHSRVRVCVLDTGCSINHSDLTVDTYLGREFVTNDDNTCTSYPLKGDGYLRGVYKGGCGHGTSVAGIIGALANNAYGISGVASCYDNNVLDIVPIDVFQNYKSATSESAYVTSIIEGLKYAKSIDAKVVNMSLGAIPESENPAYKAVCADLASSGITIVASAGNENTDAYTEPSDFQSVISVVATDQSNNKASFSSYGPNKNLSAPGVNIYTTCDKTIKGKDITNDFAGTSAAAPIVTGTIAMMLSVNSKLTTNQIAEILYSTTTDLGAPGKDNTFGFGLVNAERAVKKSAVIATGIYKVTNENSLTLGCVHDGGCSTTKYQWVYHNMNQPETGWSLISDWSGSEWCTWYPDANESYMVVCNVSYSGDGVVDSQVSLPFDRPQMNADITGTCVTPL